MNANELKQKVRYWQKNAKSWAERAKMHKRNGLIDLALFCMQNYHSNMRHAQFLKKRAETK